MKTRLFLVSLIICITILTGGYYLDRSEMEVSAAAPLDKPTLNMQTTEAETTGSLADQTAIFTDENFDYELRYPLGWYEAQLQPNKAAFLSPDGQTHVTVEAVGPLAEPLAALVDRHIGDEPVFSHQMLTINGLAARRVVTDQATTFYVDADSSAYVISGSGEQQAIEMIARTFQP